MLVPRGGRNSYFEKENSEKVEGKIVDGSGGKEIQ